MAKYRYNFTDDFKKLKLFALKHSNDYIDDLELISNHGVRKMKMKSHVRINFI